MPHYSILPASTALVTDTVNVSMSPKDIEEQNRTEQDTGHQQYCILFQTCQLVRTFVCRSQSETLTHATLLLPHKASLLCQRLFPLTAHTQRHQHQAEGYILLLAATFWLKDCGQNEMFWPLAQRTQCSSANQVWITGNKSKWAWLSYSLDWAIGNFRNSTAKTVFS